MNLRRSDCVRLKRLTDPTIIYRWRLLDNEFYCIVSKQLYSATRFMKVGTYYNTLQNA